jgi:hypothetical protein
MKACYLAKTGCAVLAMMAAGSGLLFAGEVTVAAGGGADFTNIADAIAGSNPGDTIRVTDQGAYGAFAFNSRILVSDPPGASITATVVVDGPVGTVTTIDGFEFLGVGNAIFLNGGGGSAGTLNVLNCNFESVSFHGILLNGEEDGTLMVEGCTFDGVGENAITLFRNATVTVKDTLINNAASGAGGQAGIFIDGALSNALGRIVTLDNTVIQNSFRGILTYRRGEYTLINGSRVSDNLLNGITLDGEATGSKLTVMDSEISLNGDRGMFIGRPVTVMIDGSTVSENVGDGFFLEDFANTGISADISILRSTFASNGQKAIFHLTPSNADSTVVIVGNTITNSGERSISVEGRPFTSRVLANIERNVILGRAGNTSNMVTAYFTDLDSRVVNNLIVGGGTGIANSQGGLSILHNTVAGSSSESVFIDEGDSQAYDIRNNIFADGPNGIATDVGTGMENVAIDYNLFFDIDTLQIAPEFTNVGTNNINGLDPLFVDSANGDYSLAEGSPAIGSGDPAAGVADDILGNVRPATPSMGAYEGDIIVTPPILGDVNGDEVVNVADVTELAGLVKAATPPALNVGDVNNDGDVDELDVAALAALIVNN